MPPPSKPGRHETYGGNPTSRCRVAWPLKNTLPHLALVALVAVSLVCWYQLVRWVDVRQPVAPRSRWPLYFAAARRCCLSCGINWCTVVRCNLLARLWLVMTRSPTHSLTPGQHGSTCGGVLSLLPKSRWPFLKARCCFSRVDRGG
jgi:hypothetical protein